MSSHHIVREKQEPALLVLGLDDFEDELLGQLLEWSPTLLVTDHTAEQVNAFGIKYDVLIGTDAGEIQLDIKHIATDDLTPAETALKYLTENGYPAVNIVTDELVLDDYLPYASLINMVIFNNVKKIYPVTSGFTKWKPGGDMIEIISESEGLECTGLQKIGESQYQTVADGFFALQFSSPYLFIAESIA